MIYRVTLKVGYGDEYHFDFETANAATFFAQTALEHGVTNDKKMSVTIELIKMEGNDNGRDVEF